MTDVPHDPAPAEALASLLEKMCDEPLVREAVQIFMQRRMAGFLQEALSLDRVGIGRMLDLSVRTTKGILDHPDVAALSENGSRPTVNVLSLISGLCGGDHAIDVLRNDEGAVISVRHGSHPVASASTGAQSPSV